MKTLSSPLLSAFTDLLACFTTRHGGMSRPPYTNANLAFHVGDDAADVLANHELLARALGYERPRLVHMRQIHSDRIVVVEEGFGFDVPPECDALVTNRTGTPLMVMSADCTPILLYDPLNRAIGAVHAGRAGALKKILPKTIEAMAETYGTRREDLHISMGPSIEGCCYEINAQIAAEVEALGYRSTLRFEGEKVFLDVNTILRIQLEEMGTDQEKIEMIGGCTACERGEYFSYRADAQKTGRIAGVIMIR
jgi:YfiH family protein